MPMPPSEAAGLCALPEDVDDGVGKGLPTYVA